MGIDLSPATTRPPLSSPGSQATTTLPSPHPGFADAGHRTPRLRSRRPLSAAAAPRPSSIRPRRGRAPGFLHPCHAAAPRLAAESHEPAHAVRLSHAGSLVLSPPPQPRALSRVLPRLASAGSPTRAMNLLRALALLQPEYLICLVDEARSDMSTHCTGYPYPSGIIHVIWGWIIWIRLISGYGYG